MDTISISVHFFILQPPWQKNQINKGGYPFFLLKYSVMDPKYFFWSSSFHPNSHGHVISNNILGNYTRNAIASISNIQRERPRAGYPIL
nr:unnamed protein product [Haemonchus contortus]